MATTTIKKTTSGTGLGVNLSATVEAISDIPIRLRALETIYGLRGQLCWSMESTHQVGDKAAMIWNVGMQHLDGRDIVALRTGPNPVPLVNQVFREANRILKTEYGPAAGQAGSTPARRSA